MRLRGASAEGLWLAVVVLSVIGILISSLVFIGRHKSDAWRRVTGQEIDPWDAIFLDLHVDAPPKARGPSGG